MNLLAFLKKERNSVTREALLRHRLIYDLGLAAARRGYALQVFLSDVDREGYDVVLDDADLTRKVQLKSVAGKAKRWAIQKNLLRPQPYLAEGLGFLAAPTSIGVGGAVVLQLISGNAKVIDVEYAVTDIGLIRAMEAGFIRKRTGRTPRKTLARLLDEITTGKRTDQVVLPRGVFIRTRSPGHLLAALGLHSPDVHCGFLDEIVAAGMSGADEAQRLGSQALVAEHLAAISPDF